MNHALEQKLVPTVKRDRHKLVMHLEKNGLARRRGYVVFDSHVPVVVRDIDDWAAHFPAGSYS